MPKKTYLLLALFLMSCAVLAQPKRYDAGDIHQQLRKLNVLGSVLYVAAHPDDENTSVIAYYANEELFRTAYLSATRGDGGQNLVGPEIREQLGIIRTQELLAARRTDGGQQFFSRANDFGYSKNPDETFNLWNKQEILSDFVWVFRKFRPDVILTRFDDQPPNHGHHTASVILAREAFKLAGDKNAFPEQLKYVEPWQPKRVYWNVSPWTIRRKGMEIDDNYGQIPIGAFNPAIGLSYTEISALSRSMHKSQGFGATGSRGERDDFVFQYEGEKSVQPFEGIETGWGRVKGGEKIQPMIDELLASFDPMNPEKLVSDLLKTRKAIQAHVKDEFWKDTKIQEIDELLISVTGTYLEIRANDYAFVPGDSIELTLEAVNRSSEELGIVNVNIEKLNVEMPILSPLAENRPVTDKIKVRIPTDMPYSQPYWLRDKGELGRYRVDDQMLRGLPENPLVFDVDITLTFGKEGIEVRVPVIFKETDRVDGEVYRPLVIQPAVMANIESSALIFASDEPKEVSVRVIAGRENVNGDLRLELPEGWGTVPEKHTLKLFQKHEEQVFNFSIKPPSQASEGAIRAVIDLNGKRYDRGRKIIEYDHIPTQTLFPESSTRVVRLDLKKESNEVGYIMGAGDEIPKNLEQVGYNVTLLGKDDVSAEKLRKFQAVIVGIRAFNTEDWLAYKNKELFEYVQNGGNVIVQYITTWGLPDEPFSPYDITISRERVAVEEAEVRILAKDHPVVNSPNKITQKDFDGWVQERGLYFADEWADEFTPILSSNDPGEPPRDGGLLVAKYGKGYYVYTGYSWFRELPAGVPGAYRIFTNLIELGNDRINN